MDIIVGADDVAQDLAQWIGRSLGSNVKKLMLPGETSNLYAYAQKPIEFCKDILGVELWGKQREILESVIANRLTVVEAAHGVGKTLASAIFGIFWLVTHKQAILLTTAPTYAQVNGLLWRYIRGYAQSARVKIPGTVMNTPRWEISPLRYGIGLSPRKSTDLDVTALQGFHSPYLLVIMDEAAGLPVPLWNAALSLVTGEKNRLLAIGNPIAKSGPFYDATVSPTFHALRISCLEHPNIVEERDVFPGAVSVMWVEDRIKEWCHVSRVVTPKSFEWKGTWYDPLPVFEARVLGRPPDEAESQLIPYGWVQRAIREGTGVKGGERVIGLDPARFGDAASTMLYRIGDATQWVKRQQGNNLVQTAEWLMKEMVENEIEVAYVDEIGIGGAIVDFCHERGVDVVGVNVSRPAMQKTRFINLRVELWWRVREKLRKEEMVLPDDEYLVADLIAPEYGYDAMGRLKLEDKEETTKRLGRSPDSGDALMLSYMGQTDVLVEGYAEELAAVQVVAVSGEYQGSRWAGQWGK